MAALVAIAAGAVVLWLATFAGLVAARLPAGGSAYLALAVVAVVPVFVGVGALASQLAPNRRIALELGSGALAAAFLLRVVADTSSLTAGSAGSPRSAGSRSCVRSQDLGRRCCSSRSCRARILLGLAAAIALRRDVGSGLLHARDEPSPACACSPRRPRWPCEGSAAA